jgi:hypothetical protein
MAPLGVLMSSMAAWMVVKSQPAAHTVSVAGRGVGVGGIGVAVGSMGVAVGGGVGPQPLIARARKTTRRNNGKSFFIFLHSSSAATMASPN